MKNHRASLGRLPVELLSEIFEQSKWELDMQMGWRITHPVSQTILLSSVCRHWRAAALSTPRLWTTIVVDLNRSREILDLRWETQRLRAGAVAVDLTFKNMPTFDLSEILQEQGSDLRRFDPTMIPNISSLTYMATVGNPIAMSLLLLDPFDFRYKQVETLRIIGSKCSPGEVLDDNWDWAAFLAQFKGLQAVEVVGEHRFLLKDGLTPCSLDSIQSLKLVSVFHTTIARVLHLCPNLEDLRIVTCGVWDIFGDPAVRSENVVNFELRPRMAVSGVIMSSVEFPSLRSFKYHRISKVIPRDHLDFVKKHSSVINLELGGFDKQSLLLLAHVAPQVINLKLVYHSLRTILLPTDDDGTIVFPALQTLDIFCDAGGVSTEQFERFVEERCLPSSHPRYVPNGRVAPMDSFTLQSYGPWTDSLLIQDATRHSEHYVGSHFGKKMTLSWI